MLTVCPIDTSNRQRSEALLGTLAKFFKREGIKYIVKPNPKASNQSLIIFDLPTDSESAKIKSANALCEFSDIMLPEAMRDIKENKVPPLYESGVRYQRQNARACAFRYPSDVHAKGGGDCKQLTFWRRAELAIAGETTNSRVKWLNNRKGLQAHMKLRRADKNLEDPSVILGLKGAS